jgi:hypothetical protein
MAPSTVSPCAVWDLTAPALPPRSLLYPQAPLGLGTPLVESLTSYLGRLADLYAVSLWALYERVILPRLTELWLTRRTQPGPGPLACHAHKVNGVGAIAADLGQVLALTTGRADLGALTMRRWSPVVSAMCLLRRRSAWCAACFADWRASGQPCYTPLLWTLQVVAVCPVHRGPLQERCPACRRSHALLTARSHAAGVCPWCGNDLAAQPPAGDARTPPDAEDWPLWAARAVGQLLSLPLATAPTRRQVAVLVERCVPALAPSFNALAHAARLQPQSICNWRYERYFLRLGHLCRLCYAVGLRPQQIFTSGPAGAFPVGLAPASRLASLPRPAARRERAPLAMVRQALEAALVAEPPQPLGHVAHQLNYRDSMLPALVPDLRPAIRDRYARFVAARRAQREQERVAAIEQAVRDLVARGVYPSHGRVNALLPFALRHPPLIAAWRAAVAAVAWGGAPSPQLPPGLEPSGPEPSEDRL